MGQEEWRVLADFDNAMQEDFTIKTSICTTLAVCISSLFFSLYLFLIFYL